MIVEGKTKTRESRERKVGGEKEEGKGEKRRSESGAKGWVIRSFWENRIRKKTVESLLPTKVWRWSLSKSCWSDVILVALWSSRAVLV